MLTEEKVPESLQIGAYFHQAHICYLRALAEDQTVQFRTLCHNKMNDLIPHLHKEMNKNLFSITGLSAHRRQSNESSVLEIKMYIFPDAL